jgi:hypothetical protein
VTLVIGRANKGRVAIAADTRLTEHGGSLPVRDGAIKSCMLPGNICASFSNSPELAAKAFQSFAAKYPEGAGFGTVIDFFEDSSGSTGNDYLLAFGQSARIVKIADGARIRSAANTHWIGDHAAFARLREFALEKAHRPHQGRAFHTAFFADEMDDSPASDLFSALRDVVSDSQSASVGGFVSVISSRETGFRFSAYSDMLHDWPAFASNDYVLNPSDKISLQSSGENAGYAVAQISPGSANQNLVAYYVVKAKLLYLFHGRDNALPTSCEVFSNVPPAEICGALNDFMGSDLGWLFTITSPRSSGPHTGRGGAQLSFFVEANSFPSAS